MVGFAKYAKDYNYKISSFNMDRKYSLLYYNDEKVDYNSNTGLTVDSVKNDLTKKDYVIIIRNKEMYEIEGKLDYNVIKVGRRYTMIKGK